MIPRISLRFARILRAAAILALLPPAALACGADSDCVVGDRAYRIVLPEARDGPTGAIVYLHGYRGTAARAMRNKALTGLAAALGVAVIAAQANGIEWNAPGAPQEDVDPAIDELGYFDALAADAAARFGLDRARFVVTGFSSGAMMVWTLACARGDAFAGFAPMSGTFWRPLPEDCPAGAVNLIHTHGREDPIVPLDGRPIKDAVQGDVREAMALMTRAGGYGAPVETTDGDLACERRTDPAGKLLELCLFTGKHSLKVGAIARAWKEIAAAGRW